jgi:ubiquinone/menaquinone biosynthesis C-methylase UbiE
MANDPMLTTMASNSAVPERLVPGTLAWELYEVEHKQRYEWAARYCSGKIVLDVACGTGYGSEILRESGAAKVIGADLALDAINTNSNGHRALFTNADACKLPFPDQSFDTVVSFETIEHVESPERLLMEIARVLKPGGICICSSPNRDFQPASGNKDQNPFHISEMNYGEFEVVFTKYFCISESFSQTHSQIYLRHLQLLRELDARLKPIRFSRLLRLEKKIRGWLGRDSLNGLDSLPEQLARAVPGDYIIAPLIKPANNLLTFIFVGSKA